MQNPGAGSVSCCAALQLVTDLNELYREVDAVGVRYYDDSLKYQNSAAAQFFPSKLEA